MEEKSPIRSWLEEHRQEFINDMMEFFRIPSVSEKQDGPYPFGKECAHMLDKALEMSRQYGFLTENHQYYCGSALLGGAGDGELGVFSHVDVVEEGAGWSSPPYDPVIKDGWIYARGSSDNKGPAVAALYALRYLREQKIPLKHTVRLYFGCNEEHGMEDIEYYISHCPIPRFSIVPDASFSVCYGEKGKIEGRFSRRLEGNIVSMKAGHSDQAVPDRAWALLREVSFEEAREAFAHKDGIEVEEQDGAVKVSAMGKTAHVAFPENSESAAVKLAQCLLESGVTEEASKESIRFIKEGFQGYYGTGMGAACEDQLSGKLTLVGGRLWEEDNTLYQTMNLRYPASEDFGRLAEIINRTAGEYGWNVDFLKNDPSYVIDPEDEKIKRLDEICSQVWKRRFEPYAMGGGTYARKLPNAVAYGPGILDQKKPGWPDRGKGHQPDECVCIENMMKAMEIYTRALMELDEMVE